MAKLSSAELAKREDIIKTMKKNKRGLVKRYGSDAEKVMYGRATNIAKKVTETQMKDLNLKELVRTALMQEKKFPDLTGDGEVTQADILKGRGVKLNEESGPAAISLSDSQIDQLRERGAIEIPVMVKDKDGSDVRKVTYALSYTEYQKGIDDIEDSNLEEDLDLGHEDDEPHMIKSELYRIGKYAMELYQMVDQFEGEGEVDFPAWWQAKITTAKNMVSSAKHYLEFELKEPEIDAMVGVAAAEDIIPNIPSEPLEDEIEEGIHDRDITSAPHTNVKGEMGAYNPSARAASLKKLANFGPKKNDDEIKETLAQKIAKQLKSR